MNEKVDIAFHALSDRTRRTILVLLSQGERRVGDVASNFSMSLPAVSKHIRVLESAGLVTRRVEGREHFLSVVPGALDEVTRQVTVLQYFWQESLQALENFVVPQEETMSTHTARVSRVISAPRETLFDAWLDAQSMNKWMCPMPGGSAKCTIDARVGGSFAIDMFAPDGTNIPHTGEYLSIVRPERLEFTWNSPSTKDTRVTVTFADKGGSTKITIVHELFIDQKEADDHKGGWTVILEQLAGTGR